MTKRFFTKTIKKTKNSIPLQSHLIGQICHTNVEIGKLILQHISLDDLKLRADWTATKSKQMTRKKKKSNVLLVSFTIKDFI